MSQKPIYGNSLRDCYPGEEDARYCGNCKWFGEIRSNSDDGYCNKKQSPTIRAFKLNCENWEAIPS